MWTSSDRVWSFGIEFSMLVHSPDYRNRKHTAKLRSRTRRKPVAHLFHSWKGKRSQRLLVPASSIGIACIADDISVDFLQQYVAEHSNTSSGFTDECSSSNSLVSKLFSSDYRNTSIRRKSQFCKTFSIRDQFVEEPWLLQSSLISHRIEESDNLMCNDSDIQMPKLLNKSGVKMHFNDNSDIDVNKIKNDCEQDHVHTNYPVEEPWLFESPIRSNCSTVKMVPDVSIKVSVQNKASQPANEQHQSVPEALLHEAESKVMAEEDSVSTVILINSSICTMQRIAVLENGKLVELLLEPVKNNVLCDSVYLGIVTKLVPNMGGAFVNIGSPRPSFMDIKPNREPFILSPFTGYVKEKINDSINDKPKELMDFPENGTLSYGVEEPDEVEDDQSEDEFVDDEFGVPENSFHFDVSEDIRENVNGSVIKDGHEADGKRLLEKLRQDANVKVTGKEESKWAQVQKGSRIIVQVIKEGLGTKGPTMTAYPKLKSRFWILMTRCNTIGISKKIFGAERTRLRVIAKSLQPPGFGLTVRTVASGHSLEELQKDFEGLLSTWKSITEHAKSAALAADERVEGAVPAMLHRAMGQTLSVVQDYFNEKVKSLVVDSPRIYNEVSNYLQEIAPDLCERIDLYRKRTPLFDEFNIEGEINDILSKRVTLDNGGYLVIEQTEALVSVDVNGGHCMLGQGTSQEKAILEVNLAAAKQIARELRLRDIGGIIVVDFIDMLDDSNKRLVYEEVKKAVVRDRSTVKVSELSKHGLMEITRKRVRPSVSFMISEPCTCCHATGRVEALETSFSKIEHEICRLLSTVDQKADPENPKTWPRFILRLDRHMCNYLTSGKRTRLAVLSSSLKVWILLKVARGFTRGTFELKPLTDDNMHMNQPQTALSILRPTEVVRYTPNRKVTIFPIKKGKTGGK